MERQDSEIIVKVRTEEQESVEDDKTVRLVGAFMLEALEFLGRMNTELESDKKEPHSEEMLLGLAFGYTMQRLEQFQKNEEDEKEKEEKTDLKE